MRNEKGFTLIEIIAVLVILGILAAVAIPKFMDLQDDSRKKAAEGFVSAAQSAISMGYASFLIGNASAPAGPQSACNNTSLTLDCPTGSVCTVACTGAAWNVTNSTISANYQGQIANGTWTKP